MSRSPAKSLTVRLYASCTEHMCWNMVALSSEDREEATKEVTERGWRWTENHGWLCDEHEMGKS